ncbi:hypothetical protein BDA96_04G039900 [Sorghum bicolor]|uniref:Uncharacterized protein n=1 Tax=Sorghum bicolor TaxID=4558 RepID=A0A921UHB8_SORBI|nr:hypothetical protein BDA96_04G039900 [Sorghum bicolor]
MACRPISPQSTVWMRLAARLEDAAPSAGLLPLLLHLLRFAGLREPCQSMLLPVPSLLPKKTPKQERRCRQLQQERIYIVSTDLLPS